jgi:UDP-glucose 4-epimerase
LQKILNWQPRRNDIHKICRTALNWEKKLSGR